LLGSHFGGEAGSPTGYPESSVSKPVVPVVSAPHFNKEDRVMDNEQIAQFMALYPVIGNMQKCLAKIGCSNRYSRHASLIVKEFGLKKEKA
jgi:hypothetical protein